MTDASPNATRKASAVAVIATYTGAFAIWLGRYPAAESQARVSPMIAIRLARSAGPRRSPLASATTPITSNSPGTNATPTAIVTASPAMDRQRPSGGSADANATSSRSTSAGSTINATSNATRPSEKADSTTAESAYADAATTDGPGRPVSRTAAR